MNVRLILRLAVEIARETQGLGTNFETLVYDVVWYTTITKNVMF